MPGLRVRVTETFACYWNYQVWPLTEGQEVSGGLADHLLATASAVERVVSEPAPAPRSARSTKS